jgi:hypothetical protein
VVATDNFEGAELEPPHPIRNRHITAAMNFITLKLVVSANNSKLRAL